MKSKKALGRSFLGCLLILTIIVGIFLFFPGKNVFAEETTVTVGGKAYPVWDGSSFSLNFEGEGTESNPYQVGTPNDLALLSHLSNYTQAHCADVGISSSLTDAITAAGGFPNWSKDKVFRLTSDLYLNDVTVDNWLETANAFPMISNRNAENGDKNGFSVGKYYFHGTLDGDGHVIYGFKLTNSDDEKMYTKSGSWDYTAGIGLVDFLGNGGKIVNLGIIDAFVKGKTKVGTFVSTMSNGTLIDNCYTDATVQVGGSSGQIKSCGGIAGYSEGSTISNCVFAGTATAMNTDTKNNYFPQYSAGILGSAASSNDILLKNCLVYGTATVQDSRSFSSAIVFSTASWGTSGSKLTLEDCYAVSGASECLTRIIDSGSTLLDTAPTGSSEWTIAKTSFAGLEEYFNTICDESKFVLNGVSGNPLFTVMLSSFANRLNAGEAPAGLSLITNPGYQVIENTTPTSTETGVRLVFLVRSNNLKDVGFALSLSNAEPTVGGENTTAKSTVKLYRSITAGGETLVAPEGYYYAAVKLDNIDNASFNTKIYVRPYLENGTGNYVYGEAASFTVAKSVVAEYEETHAAETLKVMTFNLNTPYSDTVYNETKKLDSDDLKARIANVTAVIAANSPDVIGFQEMASVSDVNYTTAGDTVAWLDSLTSAFSTEYTFVGTGRGTAGVDEYSSIAFKTDLFELLASDTVSYSVSGEESPRIFTWVTLKRLSDNSSFTVVNTHLDTSNAARAEEVSKLVTFLATKTTTPVIVTGDFNMTSEESSYSTLASAGYSNSGLTAYYLNNSVGRTFPVSENTENEKTVDFILYKNNTNNITVIPTTYCIVNDGTASDHFPVMTTFLLKGTCFNGHDIDWTTDAESHYGVCRVCGTEFDVDFHTFPEADPATCSHIKTCSVCGYTGSAIVHVAPSTATCGKDGFVEHWKCELCNKVFSDSNGTNEVTYASVSTPATGLHDYEWITTDTTHKQICKVCDYLNVDTESHQHLSTSLNGNVLTYTCADCGHSHSTTLYVNSGESNPSSSKFNPEKPDFVTKETVDNEFLRTTLTQTGSKIWINYNNNSSLAHAEGKTNIITFTTDFRFKSGATPDSGNSNDLLNYYYSFSGNASGSNDQGYGIKFRHDTVSGKIQLIGLKEGNDINFGVSIGYDTWFTLRVDVIIQTTGTSNQIVSLRVYLNDTFIHSANNLSYSSFNNNKVRHMIIGRSGATVTVDFKNVATYVGSRNDD